MREHDERLRRLAAVARESQHLADEDREARDTEIEQADLDGMSTREISRCTGLAKSTVHAVVVARTAARQARLARAVGQ